MKLREARKNEIIFAHRSHVSPAPAPGPSGVMPFAPGQSGGPGPGARCRREGAPRGKGLDGVARRAPLSLATSSQLHLGRYVVGAGVKKG